MSYNQSLNSNSNYPLMSQGEWEDSPMEEVMPEEREFNLLCSQTLNKQVIVFTNNYKEGVDEEFDNEGEKFSHHWIDTADTDWKEEYANNEHYTPLQLINLFKRYLQGELDNTDTVNMNASFIRYLIQECSDWSEDNCVFINE